MENKQQELKTKPIWNVDSFDIESTRGRHRLKMALAPYRDYREVQQHIRDISPYRSYNNA